ncbi:MAG TPA: hypothetical protein PKC65_01435 [Pyrinomonadaceae bacterium]|nr:hypothetical protein [Pyrinomonadaceae bacterium]
MFGPNTPFSRIRWIVVRLSFVSGILIVLSISFSTSAFAQRQDLFDSAPPPLLVASKEELMRILAPADNEDKARLALEAMDAHLSKAEAAASASSFDGAYSELGHFCAIMQRTVSALLVYNSNGRQDLDALKRFDIGLRRFLLRLENLRGEMPSSHEAFAAKTIHYLQDTRDAALKPMFADNVVAVPNSDK